MLPLHCAVLAANPVAAIVPMVLSTLRQLKDVVVDHVSTFTSEPRCWMSADGVIVVADRATLDAGIEQIARVLGVQPYCSVVAIGDALEERGMSSLLAAGAFDFVAAPFSPGELQARLRRALGLTLGADAPDRCRTADLRFRDLIGTSRVFLKETAKLPMLARHDVAVLLLGETGTGKEVFAQAIHYLSPRSSRPWVAVNCAAIPTELIESELFGHVRGAYTTAHTARKGLVSEAEGGTLLLDEIDSLSYAAQAKLLRFLQEKEFRPVGSNNLHQADVRVIATSNSRLDELAAKGSFRRDLYFRLNVLSATMPPLRERREDIPALALHFIQRFGREFSRRVNGMTPLALRRLIVHGWPGNVRELKHVIERAVLFSNGPLIGDEALDFGGEGARPAADESFRTAKARVIGDFERAYIEQALMACMGNVTSAARLAKKNRRAFWELLRKHRIDPQPYR
jgi:two-component system, NtrC family, response regulator GlrR